MMENRVPKPGISQILKSAFLLWNRTLGFQLMFSLLYFAICFLAGRFFFHYFGLEAPFAGLVTLFQKDPVAFRKGAMMLAATPGFRNFSLAMVLTKSVMYPLNIGFYEIYRKVDARQSIKPDDMFAGFRGLQFFRFAGFAVFWNIVYLYAGAFLPLALVWVLVTLFAAPLMFYMDKSIMQCIRLSVAALRHYLPEILACSVVACLFGYFGVMFFFAGILVTFPFWNAVIYTLYKNIFTEVGGK